MRASDGEYLATLEDILDLYAQPQDPDAPRRCIDERPCQFLNDVIAPVAPTPGRVAKQDYEYERNGTACVVLGSNWATAQRYTHVVPHQTKVDYAHVVAGSD